jgi:hypothetical protein
MPMYLFVDIICDLKQCMSRIDLGYGRGYPQGGNDREAPTTFEVNTG